MMRPVQAAFGRLDILVMNASGGLEKDKPASYAMQLNLTAQAIVSGDMIEGTITPKLLERTQRGLIASRRAQAGALPTVQEFASAIVDAAADGSMPNGHVSLVGPID